MSPIYHERSMIVRSEDLEARPPKWMDDHTISTELKQELRERRMADPLSRVECLAIVDDCFNCGEDGPTAAQ